MVIFEQNMKVLFLSYWSLNDGLTQSTVIPHLKILAGFSHVEKIVFCTVERNRHEKALAKEPFLEKVIYHSLFSRKLPWGFATKVVDFLSFPGIIKQLCKKNDVDLILARGTPAGALVMNVANELKIPFIVESFEPHADYMLESGVWGPYDPRYLFQKKWEKELTHKAAHLIPVTENFSKYLTDSGVSPEKIDVIPCCVNEISFSFDPGAREIFRERWHLNDRHIVGVYVGKFGGIYYDKEAFDLFYYSKKFFGERFFLLILSPDPEKEIQEKLLKVGFSNDGFLVTYKPHNEVNSYLSAADFAFSPIKPAPSRIYCSPVKDGEYWANGLPVLITNGVGDDSRIIEKENAGVVIYSMEEKEIFRSLERIKTILNEKGYRTRISKLASKYRSFSIAENIYKKLFS